MDETKRQAESILLTQQGAPNPWCVAAQLLLDINSIDYRLVPCIIDDHKEYIKRISGQTSLPVIAINDEIVLVDRYEIISHFKKFLPWNDDVKCWVELVAGENGLGWNRRLVLVHEILSHPERYPHMVQPAMRLGANYGYCESTAIEAPERIQTIMRKITSAVKINDYIFEKRLSVADVYVAPFTLLACPNDLFPIDPNIKKPFDVTHDRCVDSEYVGPELKAYQTRILSRLTKTTNQ